MHDRDAPSDGEQHLYLLASPLSLFVLEKHNVMNGQTDRYYTLYGYIWSVYIFANEGLSQVVSISDREFESPP